MKLPNVGDVVTVVTYGRPTRARIARSYKRRFIVAIKHEAVSYVAVVGTNGDPVPTSWTTHESFERDDEGKKWVRGWDDETAIAFRAEKALEACR